MRVYHYTTQKGKEGIETDRVIQQSTDTVTDARLGAGVYVTRLSYKNNTKEDIAQNNYGTSSRASQGYVDYAIQLDIPDYELTHNGDGRDIWCYRGRDLWIDNYNPQIIEVPSGGDSSWWWVAPAAAIGIGAAAVVGAVALAAGAKKWGRKKETEQK